MDVEIEIWCGFVYLIEVIDGVELMLWQNECVLFVIIMSQVLQLGLLLEGNISVLVVGDLVEIILDDELCGFIFVVQSILISMVISMDQIYDFLFVMLWINGFIQCILDFENGYFVVILVDFEVLCFMQNICNILIDLYNLYCVLQINDEYQVGVIINVFIWLEEFGV